MEIVEAILQFSSHLRSLVPTLLFSIVSAVSSETYGLGQLSSWSKAVANITLYHDNFHGNEDPWESFDNHIIDLVDSSDIDAGASQCLLDLRNGRKNIFSSPNV